LGCLFRVFDLQEFGRDFNPFKKMKTIIALGFGISVVIATVSGIEKKPFIDCILIGFFAFLLFMIIALLTAIADKMPNK
jgi:hypothetical protein